MPQEIGSMLIKLTADVTDLKKGVAEAKAAIKEMQDAGQGGPAGDWDKGINDAVSSMKSLISTIAGVAGVAMTVTGIFNLWKEAVAGWYDLMKAGLGTIDEYQRALMVTAGLMTMNMDKAFAPDLSTAYSQYKDYLDWLYRASIEVARKTATESNELFQAARMLAMRGVAASSKEDVETVGRLVDMTRALGGNINEQRMMLKEIRAMFETGATAGQDPTGKGFGAGSSMLMSQLEATIPGFIKGLADAREEAMKMHDAQPIFDYLKEALKDAGIAGDDLAGTFGNIYNQAKGVWDLMLIDAFGPAYKSVSQLASKLLDVFYQNGALTAQGQAVSQTLGGAWEFVRSRVEAFVLELTNNPDKINQVIESIVTVLGTCANAAIAVAQAIYGIAQAINGIDVTRLALIAGLIVSIMTGNVPAAAAAAIGLGISSINKSFAEGADLKAAATKAYKDQYGAEPGTYQFREKGTNIVGGETVGFSDDKKVMEKTIQDSKDAINDYSKFYVDTVTRVGGALTTEGNKFLADLQSKSAAGTLTGVQQAAFDKAKKALSYTGLPENAPAIPPGMLQPPAQAGAKGGHEGDLGALMKQLAQAKEAYEMAIASGQIASAKASLKQEADQLKLMWEQGKISMEDYYKGLNDNANKAYQIEVQQFELKKQAAKQKLDEELAANAQQGAEKNFPDEKVRLMDTISIWKYETEIAKIKNESDKAALVYGKQLTDMEYQKLKTIEAEQKLWATMQREAAFGPIEQKEAQVNALWEKYNLQAGKNFPKQGQPADYPGGPTGDEAYMNFKMQEFNIRFGQACKEAADAITGGLTGMIDSLISGTGDFKKVANSMFKSLFNAAMKPGLEQLTQQLMNGFKSLFQDVGAGVGLAILGMIAMIGMMLTKSGGKSDFTASGVTSSVTSHEAVRGVISGETSIPIAQIGTQLVEALVPTNGILTQIEQNTRGLQGLSIHLDVNIAGLQDMMQKALEKYFADMGMKGGA